MKDQNLLLLVLLGAVGFLLYKTIGQPGREQKELKPSPPPGRTFDKRGSDYIRFVQDALNRIISAGLTVDGILGPKTKAMITTYQGMCGVPASGVMDEATETCLRADIARFPERF